MAVAEIGRPTPAIVLRERIKSIVTVGGRAIFRRAPVTLSRDVRVFEFGEAGWDCFFGYHDVTPFGADDDTVLAMRRRAGRTAKAAGTPLELGFFDLPDHRFRPLALTTAWCWQQGCRLQRLPGGSGTSIIFNRTCNGRHETAVVDTATGKETGTLDRPTYALSPDGRRIISLNFCRLQRLRPGYGYDDLPDATADDPAPGDDGLWLTEIGTGESVLLISLAEIAAYLPEPSMAGAAHYFNHAQWSPDGTRLYFLHLWRLRDGARRMRAFVCDVDAGRSLTLVEERHASHHCWLDDSRLLIYSARPKTGAGYHIYDLRDGTVRLLGAGVLAADGHPSLSPANSSLIVTDTYPDRMGEQHLLLFDLGTERAMPIGRFYSPPAFRGQVRCDLHPRWNRAGTMLCVDSAHRGERRLCIVDLAGLADRAVSWETG